MPRVDQLPPVTKELRDRAKQLRRNMTVAERKLWQRLRNRKLIANFHRQRVIGTYICDFVSLDYGLVIEVDGSQHFEETGKLRDRTRDNYLQSLGFKVLRFTNLDVMQNLEGVVEEIKRYIK